MDDEKREPQIRVLVLSSIRIYREGLSHVLAEEPTVQVMGTTARLEGAATFLADTCVDVMLFDLSVDPDLGGLRWFSAYKGLRVIALGMIEDENWVIACAEAGIAGYVTPESSLAELVQTIRDVARDEFCCPPRIAAALMRRLATVGRCESMDPVPLLTLREREVVVLIERGLSNKEIAKQLSIQLATVKNHVHNILEKLGVARRADAVAALRPHHHVPGHAAQTGLTSRI